ncbi:MAG: hypothetical protein HY078_17325 [Elusimicrobia bacterium]|nr:hypothetical protein [Elusimicrobiota bacterium]
MPSLRGAAVVSILLLSPGAAVAGKRLVLDYSYSGRNPDSLAVDRTIQDWMAKDPSYSIELTALEAPRPEPTEFKAEDLRDAPAGLPIGGAARPLPARPLPSRLLMERLPGYAPAPFASCRTLEGCAEAPVEFIVPDREAVDAAVGALVRPWILLQQAQNRYVRITRAAGKKGRLLEVKLGGYPGVALEVFAAAAPEGGFRVWLDGNAPPAAFYIAERERVLRKERIKR